MSYMLSFCIRLCSVYSAGKENVMEIVCNKCTPAALVEAVPCCSRRGWWSCSFVFFPIVRESEERGNIMSHRWIDEEQSQYVLRQTHSPLQARLCCHYFKLGEQRTCHLVFISFVKVSKVMIIVFVYECVPTTLRGCGRWLDSDATLALIQRRRNEYYRLYVFVSYESLVNVVLFIYIFYLLYFYCTSNSGNGLDFLLFLFSYFLVVSINSLDKRRRASLHQLFLPNRCKTY